MEKILCPFFVLFLATTGIGFALPDLEVTEIRLDGQCRVVTTVKNNGSAISQEDFENSICAECEQYEHPPVSRRQQLGRRTDSSHRFAACLAASRQGIDLHDPTQGGGKHTDKGHD